MSSNFASLTIVAVGFCVLQFLLAIPWLIALDHRFVKLLRRPATWLIGLGTAAVCGFALGAFLNAHSDPRILARYGRFFASLIHVQLAADFFVLVFALLLRF